MKTTHNYILLAAFLFVCFLSKSFAAIPPIPEIPVLPTITSGNNEFHVNNEVGYEDLGDGTEERPWKTFNYAAGQLGPGDTLIVHGTDTPYLMNWTQLSVSGAEDQWITIKGQDGVNGQRAIFEERLSFGKIIDETTSIPVSYVYLKNILFRGGGKGDINIGIYPESNHLVFEDIEVDCKSSGENVRAIWTGDYSHSIWFKNVYVHHCGQKRKGTSPTDCGGICVKGDNIDNVVFQDVVVSDNVGDGIGGGSRISFGKIYYKNCISERNTGDGFDPSGGYLTVIIDSISRNNGGDQGAGYKLWAKEAWIVNSIAHDNDGDSVIIGPRHDGDNYVYILNSTFSDYLGVYGGLVTTRAHLPENGDLYLHLHNNVFHAINSAAITVSNVYTQHIASESHNHYFSSFDTNRDFKNNTYEHAMHFRGGILSDGTTSPVVAYYFYDEMTDGGRWSTENSGFGAGSIGESDIYGVRDPGFVDEGNGDLRLVEGSLGIDAGVDVGIPLDIDGLPRVSGVAVDMGAYEFQQASADLSITMAASQAPAELNKDISYNITVLNQGPDAANGVTVVDVLPEGVDGVEAVPSLGSCSVVPRSETKGRGKSVTPASVSCDLGVVGVSDVASIAIYGVVVDGPLLINTAVVDGDIFDPDASNNDVAIETAVVGGKFK